MKNNEETKVKHISKELLDRCKFTEMTTIDNVVRLPYPFKMDINKLGSIKFEIEGLQYKILAVDNDLILKRIRPKIEVPEFLTHKHLLHDIDFEDGTQYLFRFENGFGASVVNSFKSYTNRDDEWEIAVIRYEETGFEIIYDTDITADVIGYQSVPDVLNILDEIKQLKGDNDEDYRLKGKL